MFTNRLLQLKWLAVIVVMLTAFSCSKSSKDSPSPNPGGNGDKDVTPSITAISIINAGENGDQSVDGTIDEDAKKITFDDVDPNSDLSAVKFDVTTEPSGATLSKDSYDFGFGSGDEKKTIAVKVVNGSKDKEYLVTISLAVPKTGGDFDNVEVYDYSNATTIYPDFHGMLVRGSDFDGNQVLVVSRDATGPHLLNFDDLKNGNINPIPLDLTGVDGGTFPYNGGIQTHGHTYVCNLATSMKLYHWDDPNAAPDLIYEGNLESPFVGRFGDYMTGNIDEDGNGILYFSDNSSGSPWGFGKLTISNFTDVTDVDYFEYPDEEVGAKLTYTMTINRVGNTDKYIEIGYDSPLFVTGSDGNPAKADFELSPGALPTGFSDARVLTFNGKRYLIGTTTWRHDVGETSFYVYDISKGDDVIDALEKFDDSDDKDPVYKYSLQGDKTIAPGTRTDFHIVKDGNGNDEKLLLYTAGTDAGFAIIEVPAAEE